MLQSFAYAVSKIATAGVPMGLYPSTVTIQARAATLSTSGWPTGAFSNRSGMVNIPCKAAPNQMQDLVGLDENKTPADISQLSKLHILLAGYYPTIAAADRAMLTFQPGDTAVAYDIVSAENDSQGATTRLRLELYKV